MLLITWLSEALCQKIIIGGNNTNPTVQASFNFYLMEEKYVLVLLGLRTFHLTFSLLTIFDGHSNC